MSQHGEVPESLRDHVAFIRERFNDGFWNADESTKKLCYLALHPGFDLKQRERYEDVAQLISRPLRPVRRREIASLRNLGTLPSLFAYYYELRKEYVQGWTLLNFREFWLLAEPNRSILSVSPAAWAREQCSWLLRLVSLRTRQWLKEVCDTRPLTSDLDELLKWPSWRAPMLLVMEPSRFAVPQPDRYWERQDEATTRKWLDEFVSDVVRPIEVSFDRYVSESNLAEAKATPASVSPKEASISARPTSVEFRHSEDYRSIAYKGEDHALTERQAIVIRVLHEARKAGRPYVTKVRLIAEIEANGIEVTEGFEMRDVFKRSRLWKSLVRSVGRSTYRLALEVDDSDGARVE